MNGLSTLLLPDVSRLPLPAVAELKVEVKDYLDPMRAEMLRLTKQRRGMVEGEYAQEDVAREAVNLIATEIEPVVRESAKRIEDVMRSRWKKILQGTLNFIGISGLGLLNPGAFAKDAAMSGVKFITELPDVVGRVEAPTQAARFVLEVKQKLSK